MIIKIIPETDMEKKRVKSVTHKGVKEFFIFGNKKEDDGDLIDFHDWSGGYRYLIGSMKYFDTIIESEMLAKGRETANEISLKPQHQGSPNVLPFIKKGSPMEQNVNEIVTEEGFNKVVDISLENQNKTPILDVERTDEPEVVEENDQAEDK